MSAQQHGMVALDAQGEPVYDALLWNDVRSAPQAARLRESRGAEAWAREVGVVPVASFTVTKLAWLADERPDLADRVDQVLLPHDWLTWQLTGRPDEAVTDRSDASGTGYWSVPEGRYRTDVLADAFGRTPRLPRVLGPAESAGETPTGALVGPGCGDNAGAALGLGLGSGDVAISIGTSGTVFASTADPVCDPSGAVAGFADATGRYLPLLATINAARILTTTAGLLGVDLTELDRLAQAGAPDADGLAMVPYLDGERTPNLPDATGSLLGMTGQPHPREPRPRRRTRPALHARRRPRPAEGAGRQRPAHLPDRRWVGVVGRAAGGRRPPRLRGRHPQPGRVRRAGRRTPSSLGRVRRQHPARLAGARARDPRATTRHLDRRGARQVRSVARPAVSGVRRKL